jgi:hypothetical protein
VKVHCVEGVAIHNGPEPCAGIREGVGEASVGEHVGQPLSHERRIFRTPTLLYGRKAKREGAIMRVPDRSGVVRDPGMHGSSLLGNREISGSAIPSSEGLVRSGKARSRSR